MNRSGHGSTDRLGRLVRLSLKELREILRDRRTIITLILMPLLLYPLLSIAFQRFFVSSFSQLQQEPQYILGFTTGDDAQRITHVLMTGKRRLDEDSTRLGGQPEADRFQVLDHLFTDLPQAVETFEIDVGIRLVRGTNPFLDPRQDLSMQWDLVYDRNSQTSRDTVTEIERYVAAANRNFLEARLKRLDVTQPAVPVQLVRHTIDVPHTGGGTVSVAAIVPFILILMTITGAVYPAIDLTAGERERGTLEILVSAPIPRVGLLFAKYVAVLTVALLTATANLVTMTVTVVVSGLGPTLFGNAGVSPGVVAAVFGLLLLFAAFFSAVLLVLTSCARSFKEAQAYLIPLMLVSLAPGVLSLTPGLELKGILLVTPLVNIVLLGRDLFEMRASGAAAVTVVASTLLYAGAAIALAARLFGGESVLYSSQTGWGDLFRRPARPQSAPTLSGALACLALLFPAYFLANNVLAHYGSDLLATRLLWGAAITACLFGGFPLLGNWLEHVPLQKGFRLTRVSLLICLPAMLLGLSLWTMAHEVVVVQQQWGLVSLDPALLERARELIDRMRGLPLPLLLLCIAVVPAVFEELFFRGYLFGALRQTTSVRTTILGSAILFGLFHLIVVDGLAFERLVPSTLLGVVLGWIAWRTGSVLPGIVLHLCHNGWLMTVSYYARQLEARGWGVGEATHLPASWLVCGIVMAVVAAAWMWLATRPTGRGRMKDEGVLPPA